MPHVQQTLFREQGGVNGIALRIRAWIGIGLDRYLEAVVQAEKVSPLRIDQRYTACAICAGLDVPHGAAFFAAGAQKPYLILLPAPKGRQRSGAKRYLIDLCCAVLETQQADWISAGRWGANGRGLRNPRGRARG